MGHRQPAAAAQNSTKTAHASAGGSVGSGSAMTVGTGIPKHTEELYAAGGKVKATSIAGRDGHGDCALSNVLSTTEAAACSYRC